LHKLKIYLKFYCYFSDGRVSFFAFVNDKIFQAAQITNCTNPSTLSSSATVQSTVVFSASVTGTTVQNLTEKVKLKFQYKNVRITADTRISLLYR